MICIGITIGIGPSGALLHTIGIGTIIGIGIGVGQWKYTIRAHLHQVPASTLRQLCDDASDSALIEINGDA